MIVVLGTTNQGTEGKYIYSEEEFEKKHTRRVVVHTHMLGVVVVHD
jgi:hypothetical protein